MEPKKQIRIVVSIDVEADSLTEGYGIVNRKLTADGFAWESSDEAYIDGEQVGEEELVRARSAFYEHERAAGRLTE